MVAVDRGVYVAKSEWVMGELQKRIQALFIETVRDEEKQQIGATVTPSKIIQVEKIVGEMRKDFEKTIIYLPMGTTEERFELLLNERILQKQWFEKWLSEDEQ